MLAPDGSGVEVPEALRPLSWLIGTWVGVGTGQYPTIEDFRFGQEVVFATDGRPFLSYHSRSWLLDDEGNRVRPLASETGYWRPRPDNAIELVLAHPTGYAEVWVGSQEVTSIVDTGGLEFRFGHEPAFGAGYGFTDAVGFEIYGEYGPQRSSLGMRGCHPEVNAAAG
mgnify:CR=1 FL=1